MKIATVLPELASWLETYKAKLLHQFDVPLSEEKVRSVHALLIDAEKQVRRICLKNRFLSEWSEDPSQKNVSSLEAELVRESKAVGMLEKSACVNRVSSVSDLLSSCRKLEQTIESEIRRALWKSPETIPEDYSSAFIARVLIIAEWVRLSGNMEKVSTMAKRIECWLEKSIDGTGYRSPIMTQPLMGMIEDRFPPDYLKMIRTIACVAEVISMVCMNGNKDELMRIVEQSPSRFNFSVLDDFGYELGREDNRPIEPELLSMNMRCGVCFYEGPWDGTFPIRCPKCEEQKAIGKQQTVPPDQASIAKADDVLKKRRGRLPNEESKLLKTSALARLREHPTLADDPAKLALLVGTSEASARRWIDKFREANLRRN